MLTSDTECFIIISVKTQHDTLNKYIYVKGGLYMTVIHNRINQLRKKKGVSQQELADYLGIERTSLSKIENMRYNPSARIISETSNFFNLPIGDIFFNRTVSDNDTKRVI